MVVLDTCAIIELCKKDCRFSASTIRQIEAGAYILSVSFAEIACKVKFGKLEMNISTEDLYFELAQVSSIQMVDIGVEEWLDSINLDWKNHNDPTDRLITAFAMKKKIPIVTTDNKIEKLYKKVIW